MVDNRNHFSLYGKSPIYQLFISLLIIIVAGIVLFNVLILAGTLIFDRDFGNLLQNALVDVDETDIKFLRYILISQDIALFIIPALIILILLKPGSQSILTDIKPPELNKIILVIILTFSIFPITSFTGQLNFGMHLPDWLSGVEQWMHEKEDSATNLIDTLIASEGIYAMIFNLFMIAVFPAIGEELIFRGVLQKILSDLFKSGHLAVWSTALLFSAIHFQFFGFIPRFILGLVFGYLFLWSGTLWLPVISHFINNAVPVIGAYIQGWEKLNTQPDINLWKQVIYLPVPLVISIAILIYFRNRSKKEPEISGS